MVDKNLKKEVKKMTLGIFIMSAVMVVIFALCGFFDMKVILGALLGASMTSLNFYFLGASVEKSVEKGEAGAKNYMGMTYTLRILLVAATIIIGIKVPVFNYIAVAIPFLFPRILIMIFNFYASKKGKGGDNIGGSENNI